MRIVTIGVYGFDADGFFRAIEQAGIDTFCDIRRHRGMRGSTYAFANSAHLQERLGKLGVRYVHLKELAPSKEVRALQSAEDQRLGIGKRDRNQLTPAFIGAYEAQHLRDWDVRDFLDCVSYNAQTVAFFCVERDPRACHRSLVAERLGHDLDVSVEHLGP